MSAASLERRAVTAGEQLVRQHTLAVAKQRADTARFECQQAVTALTYSGNDPAAIRAEFLERCLKLDQAHAALAAAFRALAE